MRRINIHAIIGFFILALSGCAVTDFDKSTDFTHYKSFSWGESEIKVENPVYDSDLIHKRIRKTVEEEFAKRGIVRNEQDPDFLVHYHTYTEEKERSYGGYPYRYPFYPFGYYPFAFHWGYPYHWMGPRQNSQYTEGTLILDIVDNGSGELVWRGSVSGDVENTAALKKQIEKGIKAIMKKYPVTPETPLNIGNDSDVIS